MEANIMFKKLLLLFIISIFIVNVASANPKFVDTDGNELTFIKTTDGYMAFNDEAKANIENLMKDTVIVKLIDSDGKQYHAAGIAIDKRHILTVNHITSATGKNFYNEKEDKPPYWATIVKQDATHDIALLEIDKNAPDLIMTPLTFAKDFQIGDNVYTVGHPQGRFNSLTKGNISYLDQVGYDGVKGIELEIIIHAGNSGGFVENEKGELVGMMFSIHGYIKNVAYMIGKDDILKFME
jgi:S1-C subfamily serine protease